MAKEGLIRARDRALWELMRVLMFPGQSSADRQLMQRALELGTAAVDIARRASTTLGWDVIARYAGPDGFAATSQRDLQLGVFITTQMHLAALGGAGVSADRSLGLSVGEYSHLVHIGALDFEAALALVDARGALCDEAPRGVMVSVSPVTLEHVEEVVAEALAHGVVVVGQFNSATQHVLSGEREAVMWAAQQLGERYQARSATINAQVPMHSPLVQGTAQRFQVHLEHAPWRKPSRPYLPNVLGHSVDNPGPRDFIRLLTQQIHRPVRWKTSLDQLRQGDPNALFEEVGPGEVLRTFLESDRRSS